MDTIKLGYKKLMVLLSSEWPMINHYLSDETKYDLILVVLFELYEDEFKPIPKQKDLLVRLGLKRSELMILLNELYQDFKLSIFQSHRYKIKKTEYYVCAETMDDESWQIGLDHLAHTPSKGQRVSIPFIKGERSFGYFEVKAVKHSIENQVHTVSIFVSDKFEDDDIGFLA